MHPPAPDGRHSTLGRVMVNPDAHPARLRRHIIHARGTNFPEDRIGEMVDAYLLGVALGLIFPARDGKVADSLLLFCLDRDDRLAGFLKRLHLCIDGVKLRVTIRMGTAFLGLAGPLQAVSEIGQ